MEDQNNQQKFQDMEELKVNQVVDGQHLAQNSSMDSHGGKKIEHLGEMLNNEQDDFSSNSDSCSNSIISPTNKDVLNTLKAEIETKPAQTAQHLEVVFNTLQKRVNGEGLEEDVVQDTAMLSEVGKEALLNIFSEQKHKTVLYDKLIAETGETAQKILEKEVSETSRRYNPKIYQEKVEMNKLIKGKKLASKIGQNFLVSILKKQKEQSMLELAYIENIKQSCGFDFKQNNFIFNQPIQFVLEPRRGGVAAQQDTKWLTRKQSIVQRGTMKSNLSRSRLHNASNVVRHADPQISHAQSFLLRARQETSDQLEKDIDNQNLTLDSNSCLFEDSHLYQMLQKDPAQRTEKDLRELRQIVMEIDFIKNNENNFQLSDLAEMVKTVNVREYAPMTRIFQEGSDCKNMLFVIQGSLVATYRKAKTDKQGQLAGRKDGTMNVDGLMGALVIAKKIEAVGEHAIDQKMPINNQDSISQGSRASQPSRRSKRRKTVIGTFFLTGGQPDGANSKRLQRDRRHKQKTDFTSKNRNGYLINLQEMIQQLGCKIGEQARKTTASNNPLNQASKYRKNVIQGLIEDYHNKVNHYVQSKDQKRESILEAASRGSDGQPVAMPELGNMSTPSSGQKARIKGIRSKDRRNSKIQQQEDVLAIKKKDIVFEVDNMEAGSPSEKQQNSKHLKQQQLQSQQEQKKLEFVKNMMNKTSEGAKKLAFQSASSPKINIDLTKVDPDQKTQYISPKSTIQASKMMLPGSLTAVKKQLSNVLEESPSPDVKQMKFLAGKLPQPAIEELKNNAATNNLRLTNVQDTQENRCNSANTDIVSTDSLDQQSQNQTPHRQTVCVKPANQMNKKQYEKLPKISTQYKSQTVPLQLIKSSSQSGYTSKLLGFKKKELSKYNDRSRRASQCVTTQSLSLSKSSHNNKNLLVSAKKQQDPDESGIINILHMSRSGPSSTDSSYVTTSSGNGDQSDDSRLESILNMMPGISIDNNELSEMPLFNIKSGQYACYQDIIQSEQDDFTKRQKMKQQETKEGVETGRSGQKDSKPSSFVKAIMRSSVDHNKAIIPRPCSLYSRRNKVFILVFAKDKYQKAIENARNRVKNTLLDYVKSVELLNLFTRNTQKKMIEMFNKRTLNRHEVVYSEGERADRIYFVISGEFKITKKIYIDNKKEEENAQLEQVYNGKTFQTPGNLKAQIIKNKNKQTKQPVNNMRSQVLDLMIITTSGVLGDEDAFIESENHSYLTSCQCISDLGELYELKQEDFRTECKKMSNYQEIVTMMHKKRVDFADRVKLKNDVQKKIDKNMTKLYTIKDQNMKDKQTVIKKMKVENQMQQNLNYNIQSQKSQQFLEATSPYSISEHYTSIEEEKDNFKQSKLFGIHTISSANYNTNNHVSKPFNRSNIKVKNNFDEKAQTQRSFLKVAKVDPLLMIRTQQTQPSTEQLQNNIGSTQDAFKLKSQRQINYVTQQNYNSVRLGASSTQNSFQVIHKSNSTQQFKPQKENCQINLTKPLLQGMSSHRSLVHTTRPSSKAQYQTMQDFNKTTTNNSSAVGFSSTQRLETIKNLNGQSQLPSNRKTSAMQQSNYANSYQKLNVLPQTQRMSLDILTMNRLLPSDFKSRSKKNRASSTTLNPTQKNIFLRNSLNFNNKNLPIQMIKEQDEDKKQMRIQQYKIIRDQDIAMRDAKKLSKQSKILHLDSKYKNKSDQNIVQMGQQAEFARANFLLRQTQQPKNNGTADLRGSYGYGVKKLDNKVHGVSALAQKISLQSQGRQSCFGGNIFVKNQAQSSKLQLKHVQSRLLQQEH